MIRLELLTFQFDPPPKCEVVWEHAILREPIFERFGDDLQLQLGGAAAERAWEYPVLPLRWLGWATEIERSFDVASGGYVVAAVAQERSRDKFYVLGTRLGGSL